MNISEHFSKDCSFQNVAGARWHKDSSVITIPGPLPSVHHYDVQEVPQDPGHSLRSSSAEKTADIFWSDVPEDTELSDRDTEEEAERSPGEDCQAPAAQGERKHDQPQGDQGWQQGESGHSKAGVIQTETLSTVYITHMYIISG